MNLAQRRLRLEPVEGLRHGDGVDRRILKRDRLSRPFSYLEVGNGRAQLSQHL